MRDYIHLVDLAGGHVAALEALGKGVSLQLYNLGAGCGTRVFELIGTFEH